MKDDWVDEWRWNFDFDEIERKFVGEKYSHYLTSSQSFKDTSLFFCSKDVQYMGVAHCDKISKVSETIKAMEYFKRKKPDICYWIILMPKNLQKKFSNKLIKKGIMAVDEKKFKHKIPKMKGNVNKVFSAIKKLSDKNKNVPISDLNKKTKNLSKKKIEDGIEKLKRIGEICEPREGILRII